MVGSLEGDRLVGSVGWVVVGLINCMGGWCVGRTFGGLVRGFVKWLVYCFVGRFISWLVS